MLSFHERPGDWTVGHSGCELTDLEATSERRRPGPRGDDRWFFWTVDLWRNSESKLCTKQQVIVSSGGAHGFFGELERNLK